MANGFKTESALDGFLTTPSDSLLDYMSAIDGDLLVLGAGGKMGVTLCGLAARALAETGSKQRVTAVSRFSDKTARKQLQSYGVETIECDLLERQSVEKLPRAPNVIFMVGRKFGTSGTEALTWAINTVAPANAAYHFADSRIVAFSTGCVYPLVSVEHGGCTEDEPPAPVGEYAQSCLGRERVFEYYSKYNNLPTLLFRLNYAIDLRYGVLHDIATWIWNDQPVNQTVTHFNVIWQGEANDRALRSLPLCEAPAKPLNVTGANTIALDDVCSAFADYMGKGPTRFTGTRQTHAYLSDASQANRVFGKPRVAVEQMIEWTADWVMSGGRSLGKPTHFEVNDGKF